MQKRNYVLGRIGLGWLLAALIVAGGGFALAFSVKRDVETPYYAAQLDAAERMDAAEKMLLQVVEDEKIEITPDDINRTGLIGPEWTALTTTLGHLEAKRSALNPNYAALLVRYYKQAGLKAGDTVAIGTSGSFPGLALATLCGANALDLKVKVIGSFGASMYGGTRPELTILRMYRLMKEKGLADYELLAVSPGGTDDHGESVLYADAQEIIARLAQEEGGEFINLPTLEESIARRLELFGEDVDLFVNVGGASANSGTSSYTLNFPNGLVLDPPTIPTTPNRGLMYEYAARGLPVINMLNVRLLCEENGLPYDPVPLPKPGEGGVYYETTYDNRILILSLALALSLIVAGTLSHRKKQAPPSDNSPKG
ncbi:MAG: poly-gamma-glutamate system protein [Clostridia bacterium]